MNEKSKENTDNTDSEIIKNEMVENKAEQFNDKGSEVVKESINKSETLDEDGKEEKANDDTKVDSDEPIPEQSAVTIIADNIVDEKTGQTYKVVPANYDPSIQVKVYNLEQNYKYLNKEHPPNPAYYYNIPKTPFDLTGNYFHTADAEEAVENEHHFQNINNRVEYHAAREAFVDTVLKENKKTLDKIFDDEVPVEDVEKMIKKEQRKQRKKNKSRNRAAKGQGNTIYEEPPFPYMQQSVEALPDHNFGVRHYNQEFDNPGFVHVAQPLSGRSGRPTPVLVDDQMVIFEEL